MTMHATAAVALALGLAACHPADEKATPTAAAAAEVTATPAAVEPAKIDGLKARAVALTTADTDCTLNDGQERTVQAVDLGGGDVGVIVACSSGMVDTWSYLYVSRDGAAPVRTPLIQYDVRGDGQWRDDDSTSELSWDPTKARFSGVTRTQATGCANGASWRWTGDRIALVEQWIITCDHPGPDGELPDPHTIWPTTPPTPEPTANNAE